MSDTELIFQFFKEISNLNTFSSRIQIINCNYKKYIFGPRNCHFKLARASVYIGEDEDDG